MRALSLMLAVGLSACIPASPPNNPSPTAPTGTTTTTTSATNPFDPPTNTGPTGSNYGSLMLVRKANQKDTPPTVEFVGVFPTNDPGYLNLAQCALVAGTCLPQIPADEDEYIDVDPNRVYVPEDFDYSFVGTDVALGPLYAWYQQGDFPYYYANLTPDYAEEGFDGTYGLKLGGEWGDYEGFEDLIVSPMMNVMSHEAGQKIGFHDGQTLVFEWEPRGEGDVFLNINDDLTVTRMYLLEDDGYFELDVDDLGYGYDEVEMKMSLSRWNHTEIEINGNELDLVSVSEVAWRGTYFFVGGREEMVAADTCGDTNTLPEYPTGAYWGRLQDWGYNDDMNTGYSGCTGFQASGEEGFVSFDLPPLTFFTMTYQLLDDDASLALVTDCNDKDTCEVGSDNTYQGDPETIQYFNSTGEDQRVHAVLDGWTGTAGLFYADVTVNTMGPPDMYDNCVAVTAQPAPTTAGMYYTTVTSFTNFLDPAGTCGISTPHIGPDAMTKIELQNNETLYALLNMDAPADPALYLLRNCNTMTSCAVGADMNLNGFEEVTYQNTSGSAETLYLVVDSKTQLEPYYLTIDIQ